VNVEKSLLGRIHDVKKKALASRMCDRQKKEVEQISRCIQNLTEFKGTLYDFDESYRAVYRVHAVPEAIDRDALCELGDAYSSVDASMDKPNPDWAKNSRDIKNLTKRIQGYKKEIGNTWEMYCSEQIKGNVAMVDTLGRMSFGLGKELISELVDRKNKISRSDPKDAEAVEEQIGIYNEKCHELLSLLKLNDEKIDFLRRLTTGGQKIYLSDIDEEILGWLKENDFANKLEVRFF